MGARESNWGKCEKGEIDPGVRGKEGSIMGGGESKGATGIRKGETKTGVRGQSKKAGGEGDRGWVGGKEGSSRRPSVLVHTKHLEEALRAQTTLSALKEGSPRQEREGGKPL